MSEKTKGPWSLGRLDIRSPVAAGAWPVARVELDHRLRGRVTDIASAPGAVDAAFAAVSQIMGVPARVRSLELHYAAAEVEAEDGQGADVRVEIGIEVDGELFAGIAFARDILPGCVAAYVDAASRAEARVAAPAQAA